MNIKITKEAIDAAHLAILNYKSDVHFNSYEEAITSLVDNEEQKQGIKDFRDEIKNALEGAMPFIIEDYLLMRKLEDNKNGLIK